MGAAQKPCAAEGRSFGNKDQTTMEVAVFARVADRKSCADEAAREGELAFSAFLHSNLPSPPSFQALCPGSYDRDQRLKAQEMFTVFAKRDCAVLRKFVRSRHSQL
jgi:hypothetical protein